MADEQAERILPDQLVLGGEVFLPVQRGFVHWFSDYSAASPRAPKRRST